MNQPSKSRLQLRMEILKKLGIEISKIDLVQEKPTKVEIEILDNEKEPKSIDTKLSSFEEQKMPTFLELHPKAPFDINFMDATDFLYYGLSSQTDLKPLEEIIQKKVILSEKKNTNQNRKYETNFLFEKTKTSYEKEYDTFIRPYLSLVISPFYNPEKVIPVSYDTWLEIRDSQIPMKNQYSYLEHAYQVKDSLSIEDWVIAIGIPFYYLRTHKGTEVAQELLEKVIQFIKTYHIELPILDTSGFLSILYVPPILEENRNLFAKKPKILSMLKEFEKQEKEKN